MTVKYGGQDFNFEPKDKEAMVSMTKDINQFMGLFTTGDESNPVDMEKWLTVLAFAQDPDNFLKGVRTSSKAEASQNILDEIRNPSTNNNTSKNLSESTGSLKEQMLKAALKSKKF